MGVQPDNKNINRMQLKIERLLNQLLTAKELGTVADLEAQNIKSLKYIDYTNLALQTRRYAKAPSEINLRRMEINMFEQGKLCLFRHDTLGYWALPFTYIEGITADGGYMYVSPRPVGDMSATNALRDLRLEIDKDCVILRDNDLETPCAVYANYYANKIAELFLSRDKNIDKLEFPVVFNVKGDADRKKKAGLTLKNILFGRRRQPYVISDFFGDVTPLDMKAQCYIEQFTELIKEYDNEYYEYIGVRHLDVQKKERVGSLEMDANQDKFLIHTEKRIQPIRTALEKARTLWSDFEMTVEANNHIYWTTDGGKETL